MFEEPSCTGCSHDVSYHYGSVCEYPKCMCGNEFFEPPVPPAARNTDPVTSKKAASKTFGRSSQRGLLLAQYAVHVEGLTDEEAGDLAEISSRCPWKRCSELRGQGLIKPTGSERLSSAGSFQQVCAITKEGREMLRVIEKLMTDGEA